MDKQFTFIDYAPAENCSNIYSFGEICVKCGKCGRKFTNAILQEDSDNNDKELCPFCEDYEDLPEHITLNGKVGRVFDTSIDYDDNGYHICLPSGADIGIKYCPYCGKNLLEEWKRRTGNAE